MPATDWTKEFPAAITVCDSDGTLLEMNDKAAADFADEGGRGLLGKNVLDCHPEPARTKTERLLASHETNIYTTEENGIKQLIYQAPWFKDGKYAGLVELSLEIPLELLHIVRSQGKGKEA